MVPKPHAAVTMPKQSSPKRRRKNSTKAAPPEASTSRTRASFSIVGIGATAGGLEALEQFLRQVPAGSGMAFVIVQHLDPTRQGIVPELLQRTTPMKVIQVKDRATVRPDCVYVIPPNKDMSILRGVLHVLAPAAPRGLSVITESAEKGRPRIAADAQRLVHELQVHQVELETQNAELAEARTRTELLLEKYTDLYDFAPVGHFSLSASGRIELVNRTGARLVGVDRSRLVGQTLVQYVTPDFRPAFRALLKRVFAGGKRETCEVVLVSAGRPPRTVSIEAERALKRPECRAVMRDITERKQAEEILRRNEALFSALIEQVPVGVYVVDGALRLRQVNPKARPVFSKVHPLVGRDFSEIIHIVWPQKVADEVMKHFRHTLQTGKPYVSTEFSERRRDSGVTESYEWQLQRITLPAGAHGVACFFHDITERKQAEAAQRRVATLIAANESANREIAHRHAVEKTLRESELAQRELLAESRALHVQLRQLARQALLAQEKERKTISRQLHDEIAQVLAGITVQLATLTGADAIPSGVLRQRISRAQRLVGKSIDVVHRFARELRPAMLDDLGLIPALRAYIRDLPGRKGLRIQFTAFAGIEALDNTRRTMLYRVAQEALINVIRHARARLVTVRIRSIAGIVSLVVQDDGKSFPVDRMLASNTHKRLGLLGMRERVELVGGRFSVTSTPGHGTTVRAEIPFRDPARGAHL
jgi:PAS domain S-box-containing protein